MGTAKWAEVEQGNERETSAWMLAHHALSRLARERATADAEEGRWLLAAVRAATHLHLGFASFSEYVERSFGYKPRSTQEKLRVAEALEELPALSEALEQGKLHWSAVRELSRVAVPQNEREWLVIAQGKSVRQLEELVAGKAVGDDPSSPPRASERRHVLRFEVGSDTFALFREAMSALRRSMDAALDDDAALLALARLALGGPRDEGRSSYQIAVTLCAACGAGHQSASGELVPIGPDVVEMTHCDGQHVGYVSPHAANDHTPAPDPSHDAHVGVNLRTEDDPIPTPAKSSLRTPEIVPRARAHVDSQASLTPITSHTLARTTQTTPPALRRAVLARDHHRCRVPGCRNSVFIDLHHLQLRSEGGRNDTENLITLCGAHHRAAHRGQLLIEGTATGPRFRHADGSRYGCAVEPRALEARAKTFRALRSLGFREADVHAVLAQLQTEGTLAAATTEQWLRAALARLTRPGSRR